MQQEMRQKQSQNAWNYSTLNSEIIPDPGFLSALESYQPKFSLDLIRQLSAQVGLQSSDERVYKCLSAMIEIQLCKVLEEVKDTNIA
mmetsp:Transcript_40694/g.29962  ORF Transcript_40694/g.29962 Transcript_40694/m.29962 type:complete len:87 (+) Transcript_40694:22-282(+)